MLKHRGTLKIIGLILCVFAQPILFLAHQDRAERITGQMVTSYGRAVIALYDVQVNTLQMRRYEKDFFLALNNAEERQRYAQLWRDHLVLTRRALDIARGYDGFSDAERQRMNEWVSLLQSYVDDIEPAFRNAERRVATGTPVAEVDRLYLELVDARPAIRTVLTEAQEIIDGRHLQQLDRAGQLSGAESRLRWFAWAVAVLGALLAASLWPREADLPRAIHHHG